MRRNLRVKILANYSYRLKCMDQIDSDRTRILPDKRVAWLSQIIAKYTSIPSHDGGHQGTTVDGTKDSPVESSYGTAAWVSFESFQTRLAILYPFPIQQG